MALPRIGTDAAWRDAARAALAARVPPEALTWSRGEEAGSLLQDDAPMPPAKPGAIRVSKAFVDLAGTVVWHSDPERFARLYAVLWRLRTEPRLMDDIADPDLTRLRVMEKAVRRDVHKTHAFVRFRELGARDAPRRKFAAWFEPTHYTLERSAPFFQRRFADMDWLIATPDLTATWDGRDLRLTDGAARPDLPEDAHEALWVTYFQNIFNPARVKVSAMLSEMPKKYWKNMPETAAIPGLLTEAEARVRRMAEAAPTQAPLFAARIAAQAVAPEPAPVAVETLPDLARALQACTRCPLHAMATQGVPGEGAARADLMMVGEQPGDQEDLAGRPFVGPAGQLLDAMLAEAGIKRDSIWLTNAVKHFKFLPRGRRRQHATPNSDEIAHCRWWVRHEIDLVQPKLLVALGASAAESLTGRRGSLLKRRGTVEEGRDGKPVFVTIHPSFLLRLPDPARAAEERALFRDDLIAVRRERDQLAA